MSAADVGIVNFGNLYGGGQIFRTSSVQDFSLTDLGRTVRSTYSRREYAAVRNIEVDLQWTTLSRITQDLTE